MQRSLLFFPELGYRPAMIYREPSQVRPQWHLLLMTLTLVGLIGGLDYATGWEWSLYAFYMLPISLIVWNSRWQHGVALAFLCAGIWGISHIQNHPFITNWGFAIAVLGHLFYFLVNVVAVAVMKEKSHFCVERMKRLEQAQQLERDILWGIEREQQRIGRDIHDSLGPHLVAIGYAMNFLEVDLRCHDQRNAQKAEQVRGMVNDAISLVRDLSHGIAPLQMEGPGLSMALEELAGTTTRLTGVSVTYFEVGEILVDEAEKGLHFYRIAQEAVNNALKHGGATKITVAMSKSETENALTLAVFDNGKGIAPSFNGSRGLGIQSMRYRARALGGDLKIESSSGEGTIVSCVIPESIQRET